LLCWLMRCVTARSGRLATRCTGWGAVPAEYVAFRVVPWFDAVSPLMARPFFVGSAFLNSACYRWKARRLAFCNRMSLKG
jgi:hypothetical protein